jgi:hypothetical protein
MSMQAPVLEGTSGSTLDHKLTLKKPARWATGAFLAALAGGLIYAGSQLISDLSNVHSPTIFPFVILGVALFIALGFEFVNGFTTPPTQWPPSSTPTRSSRTPPSSGRACGTSSECSLRRARSRSAS